MPDMIAAILNLALKRKAQGEILETLVFLGLQTSNYLWTKIQLSTFFFQVDPNFDLMLLGYFAYFALYSEFGIFIYSILFKSLAADILLPYHW